MPWLSVVGYFVVFFAAMGLGGLLFFLGGVAIVLAPGSLPTWAQISYVAFGIVGSVAIAVLAANGAFRRRHHDAGSERPSRAPSLLAWVAGILGTVLASVLSAALSAVVVGWIQR
jgi:hypothetical protein